MMSKPSQRARGKNDPPRLQRADPSGRSGPKDRRAHTDEPGGRLLDNRQRLLQAVESEFDAFVPPQRIFQAK